MALGCAQIVVSFTDRPVRSSLKGRGSAPELGLFCLGVQRSFYLLSLGLIHRDQDSACVGEPLGVVLPRLNWLRGPRCPSGADTGFRSLKLGRGGRVGGGHDVLMVSAALLTQGAGTRGSLSPFRRADLLWPWKMRLRPRAGPFLSRCAAVFPTAVSESPRQRSSLGVLEMPLEGS
ncbi:hypothetical protein NDU88_007483 [Pleurodeles waltl]|uniref:Uncharacterized protein n=1 Tax=Pleurodeles waltl TaxID=8319 RepID=A0AAV7NWS4_PLEWA|nr:hypothetical protein NDU88_007483 [Pleurodeles waltl]